MNHYKKQFGILISLGCLSLILSACSNENQIDTDNSTSLNSDQKVKANEQIAIKNLEIDANRCRGCGKCVRIDPAHFSLNQNTRKAEAISQTNLDSEKLSLAISLCQDKAISL